MPYPPVLADAIGETLGLDGSGRLLDVGCGPGSLALLLAPLFAAVVGVDADSGMISEASRRARDLDITNVEWVQSRAEELSPGTRAGEEVTLRRAGFTGPTRVEVGGNQVVDRRVDEIASAVFSLSSSAPHLFANELSAFAADLRRLLTQTSDRGWFSEKTPAISVVIWRH